MKPLIGIINRTETLPSGNKILYNYEEIVKKIIESNGIPIGINLINNIEDIKTLIKTLNGIIIQGGNEYTKEEIEIIKYLYKNNIPTLGICQGMQMMGITTCGELKKIKNHNKTIHKITIKKDTQLYKIINKQNITVNSRHNYAIKNTTLNISALSEDNIIEAIENKTKTFFIGIQWHPESLNNEDSKKIFDYFINVKGNKNDPKRNN